MNTTEQHTESVINISKILQITPSYIEDIKRELNQLANINLDSISFDGLLILVERDSTPWIVRSALLQRMAQSADSEEQFQITWYYCRVLQRPEFGALLIKRMEESIKI